MVSGRRYRLFVQSIRVSAAAGLIAGAGGLVLACSNLGLSSPSADSQNGIDGATATHDVDGGAEATVSDAPASYADAGGVTPATTSPLCQAADDASAACDPDLAPTLSTTCATLDDAGAPLDDAGADDAGLALACHVVRAVPSSAATTQACSIAGSGIDGASCEKSSDCAPSFECVGMPGRCRRYCCHGDKSCSQAVSLFCDIETMAQTGIAVPVCSPVNACDLFKPCNDANEACAVVKDDGTLSCVAVGTAKVGESCDAVHCERDLSCLGTTGSRQCYKLCRISSSDDCPKDMKCKGSAQFTQAPQYGICQ